ncbi:MAG: hypothetical protein QOG83_3093 [Alphaproteobacteria bacterium]|nr:hypothetical protein [Alphaproteobacteria bacterium]
MILGLALVPGGMFIGPGLWFHPAVSGVAAFGR